MMMHKILSMLLFLSCLNLSASEYVWKVSTSKKEAYVDEAIHLKYVCKFNDRAELYTIEFNPETENELYTLKLYTEDIRLVNGKKINTYEYIAFVKKPMVIDFSFEALMKKTNRDSIENTVLGRDNIDYEEFIRTKVKQESIKVNIKDTNTNISGSFSVDITSDALEINAFEPFHLDVEISGEGHFDAFQAIGFNIENVKIFAQKPIKNIDLGKKGYKGTWNQKFAFVSSEDFTIPARNIEYFDIASHEIKNLHMKAINVKVKKAYKKSELLDEYEESYSFDFNREYIYFLLIFLSGYLLAKVKFKIKTKDTKNTQLRDKIQNAKSLNELSMLLILNNQRKFHDILTRIDTNEITSLNVAKNKAIKLLDGYI